MADATPVGFPDGDTKVVLSCQKMYLLHSKTLMAASSTFRELLKPDYFDAQRSASQHGISYELVLVENPQLGDEDEISFVFEPVKVRGRHRRPSGRRTSDGILASLGNANSDIHYVIDAYATVLASFHGVPIDIGDVEKDSVIGMLGRAVLVAYVAEYLNCVSGMTPKIEAAFLALGQDFQVGVASHPASWLKFAYRMKSAAIFKQALIHATGKFMTKSMQREIQDDMPRAIAEVLKKKAHTLREKVKYVEKQIAAYYPAPMQRESRVRVVNKDDISRASYGNDILMWMALCAFRQFHTACLLDHETYDGADMGYGFLAAVQKGGDAYCNGQNLAGFHSLFPLSRKGMKTVEARLREIKGQVKPFVQSLLVNRSQLNTTQHPVAYFTCTTVTEEDYPWLKPQTRVT